MPTYFIEKDNKILLFDKNYNLFINSYNANPDYQGLEIKTTDREIINFEFSDTEEFIKKELEKERKNKIDKIKKELNLLDLQRIRAIGEPSIKDEITNETWLQYYNKIINDLRNKLKTLENEGKEE